jgi:MerR family transcriptional regulator, light-induced transcriptional regulator
MKEEQYNIKDLEKLTGILAHTIRIWEKRYNLLEPRRTLTNIRYYNADDLKKLLNISILNKNGIKISRISEMSDDEITQKVIELTSRNSDVEDHIQSLIMAMFNLDLPRFEKLITISYINRGFENTYTKIIAPFLAKVGLLWQTGTINPAQEHFCANAIKRKLMVAIDGLLANYHNDSQHFVLFLPEDEYHEIGLLFGYYLIKKHHHKVTYLGQSVPLNSIDEINTLHQADYLLLSLTASYTHQKIADYLAVLSTRFASQRILVFGPQMALYHNTLPPNVTYLPAVEHLKELL